MVNEYNRKIEQASWSEQTMQLAIEDLNVFNDAQESELMEYVFHVDDLFCSLTETKFSQVVYQFAEGNKITHPFKDGRAGNNWYLGFIQN